MPFSDATLLNNKPTRRRHSFLRDDGLSIHLWQARRRISLPHGSLRSTLLRSKNAPARLFRAHDPATPVL
jgi:hypothetical protein